MAKSDPAALAAALRANLRKRKAQEPQPSFGADEEGDVAPPSDGQNHPASWVSEGSKKL